MLSACAPQLPDCSIDLTAAVADGEPEAMIDQTRDGSIYDCLTASVRGARDLAKALTAMADEVDGWAAR